VRCLDVSVSGYRAWKRGGQPDRKRLTDPRMLALIRAIHVENWLSEQQQENLAA
jgi:hypothetical protein